MLRIRADLRVPGFEVTLAMVTRSPSSYTRALGAQFTNCTSQGLPVISAVCKVRGPLQFLFQDFIGGRSLPLAHPLLTVSQCALCGIYVASYTWNCSIASPFAQTRPMRRHRSRSRIV